MGKLILISGPNDSGKSAFAERLVCRGGAPRYYLATMIPRTEENFARIEKHRRRRDGLGFQVLETPYCVGDAPVAAGADVLLEDVSNLLANAVFGRNGGAEEVLRDIRALLARCGTLAAVTISGLEPGDYEGETARYVRALNRLNAMLLELADAAAEMADGSPRIVKGVLDDAR